MKKLISEFSRQLQQAMEIAELVELTPAKNEIKNVKLEKLKSLRQKGLKPYGERFERTHSVAEILANFKEGQRVVVAGRVMAHRKHGKAIFLDFLQSLQIR